MNGKLHFWTEKLNSCTPQEGLELLADELGSAAKFSTSLGMEDQVITHWIGSLKLPLEVFLIDTGRLFEQTYELADTVRAMYKIPLKVYFPQADDVEEFVNKEGLNSFYESVQNRKTCCHIRKVEPLQRALQGASVWITGLRADQSNNRSSMSMVEWDDTHDLVKYNPLIHWTWEEVQDYVKQNHIPVNKLHAKGYPTIGCEPCTRAIKNGENLRAGRWWWENSIKECGLHEKRTVKVG